MQPPAASRISCGTPCRTMPCWIARPGANWTRPQASSEPRAACSRIPGPSRALDEFVSQWLRFDRALAAARERRTFPMFSRELVVAMTEEARRFIADLVWNDRNFMDAFRANYGFINSELAAVYKRSRSGPRFRPRRVSRRTGARRPARPGAVSYVDQQAGRHRAHRPRAVRPRAVPLPAGAAASARRGYQSGARRARIAR